MRRRYAEVMNNFVGEFCLSAFFLFPRRSRVKLLPLSLVPQPITDCHVVQLIFSLSHEVTTSGQSASGYFNSLTLPDLLMVKFFWPDVPDTLNLLVWSNLAYRSLSVPSLVVFQCRNMFSKYKRRLGKTGWEEVGWV